MRFLIEHCKSAFAPLSCLNLTKRTIDKRQKVRDRGEISASLLPSPPPFVWHARGAGQNYKKTDAEIAYVVNSFAFIKF
jgi:hypothetical protein